MRADGGAFWAGRAFALAALHLPAHFGVHLFQRDVTDPSFAAYYAFPLLR